MSYKTKNHEQVAEIIALLPVDTYYSIRSDGSLSMQAKTQDQVHGITSCYPGTIWKKKYESGNNWWRYSTKIDGIKVDIYAVTEAPKSCKAITETQEVVVAYECDGERIPTKAFPHK